ncbi:MAG: hypothetical protein K6T75_11385 [Acetobacteraceae bacterium]|nr:hypothetical protein [Acetobacteraceae bacterium]
MEQRVDAGLQRLLVREWRWFEPLIALEQGRLEVHALEVQQGTAFLLSSSRPTPAGDTLELYLELPAGPPASRGEVQRQCPPQGGDGAPPDPGGEEYEDRAVRIIGAHPRWVCFLLDGRPPGRRLLSLDRDWENLARVFVGPPSPQATAGPGPGVQRLTAPVPPQVAASTAIYTAEEVDQMARRGWVWAAFQGDRPASWAAIVHSFVSREADVIGLVYTEPPYRRRGLSARVVGALSADIAARGRAAIYDASAANLASCRVARAAGLSCQASYMVLGKTG